MNGQPNRKCLSQVPGLHVAPEQLQHLDTDSPSL